ncbi:4'-phosphopantetheinyl transferase family protein [Corynebacterium lowii]|uniref:4'-phosphopantetheinyl transferase Npt n=1 Tax=Corynebacterium lowii TaxID=1544413 RepID=A0A0Q0YIP3_9CORY|nr:4'-phosphopantetheinyl transferase superfamily protein [Corynebacterium lowii]KQB86590.1 4'-phosphopantetheinyl transferase Npt [Corynebacterium lowii]MDP9851274.1 4'-phosphopantetheinyl transferase EntD [Corynebacterium lowii]
MMESLFPPTMRWRTLRVEGASLEKYRGLPAVEQQLVARAVDKRKAEFGDARWCAHRALEELGVPAEVPILRGEKGMPLWPEGFSGSLSHTEGLRAAVVAPRSAATAVGLDIEPAEPLPAGVLDSIALPREKQAVAAWRQGGAEWADRLLFCTKEATYKAWFPLTQRWLGFEEAEIVLHPGGTFEALILARPAPVPFFRGRWKVAGGYCYAAITVR